MDEDDELLQIKVVQVGEISEKEEMFENPLDHGSFHFNLKSII